MGSATLAWAVGGSSANPVVVRTLDRFQSAAATTCVAGHGAADLLDAVWVQPGGAFVHAFGPNGTRATYSEATNSWMNASPFAAGTSFDVTSVGFVDPGLGYLVGSAPATGLGAFARWIPGAPAVPVALPAGTGPLLAGAWSGVDDGLLLSATQVLVFRGSAPTPLMTLAGGGLAALAIRSGRGVALGPGFAQVLAQSGTGWSARAATGSFPIAQPTAVAVAAQGFAVAVGRGGSLAESQDGGDTWRSQTPRSPADLLAVDCWDANTCVAVGASGEMLWYRNSPPTAVVTNAAGTLDVVEGAIICLLATPSDADGDAVTLLWSDEGAGFASSTGALLDGDTTATPPCFAAPHVCGTRTYVLDLQVDDGRMQQLVPVPLVVHEAVGQPPTGLTLAPAPPNDSYDWVLGQVYRVYASASTSCGHAIHYAFSVTGALPAPTLAGLDGAVFDLHTPANCNGGTGSIRVVATDDRGIDSAPLVVPVNVTAAAFPPALELSFSNGFHDGATLGETESTTVTVVPRHGCTTGFDYAWDCGADANPGNVASYPFLNPGNLCTPKTITCSVTVTPLTPLTPPTHPPATVSFSITYAAKPNWLDVGFSNPKVHDGAVLAFWDSTSVTVAAHSACNTDPNLRWSVHWSCSGITAPADGQLTLPTIDNTVHACHRTPVSCTITATPGDGSAPAQSSFNLLLAASPPVTLSSPTGDCASPRRHLASGESFTCTARTCADAAVYWDCDSAGWVEAPSWVFQHDSAVCTDDADYDCRVRVVSSDGDEWPAGDVGVTKSGTYNPTTVDFAFSDGFQNGGTVPVGGSVNVTATATSACGWGYDYEWACMGAPEPDRVGDSQWKFVAPVRPYWDGCQTGSVACLVTAKPVEDANHNLNRALNPVGQGAVYIDFAPLPTTTTLRPVFSRGFQNHGVLRCLPFPVVDDVYVPGCEAESTELELYAGNPCAIDYDYAWSCTSLSDSMPQGAIHDFKHPGPACAPIPPDRCQVTVTPRGIQAPSATTDIEVNYVWIPPTVSIELSGGKKSDDHLGDHESVSATAKASNLPCDSPLDYVWNCSGKAPPPRGTAFWPIPREYPVCVPGTIECCVTVGAFDGECKPKDPKDPNPEKEGYFKLKEDASNIPVDLAIDFTGGHYDGDAVAPGEAFEAVIRTGNDCGWPRTIEWSCDGEAVREALNEVQVRIENDRGRCWDETTRCWVRVTTPYGHPRFATFQFQKLHEDAPAPDLLPVTGESYEPAASLALDCERSQAIRLVPRFGEAGVPSCPMDWSWRQETALPLDYEVGPDGGLSVRARPGRDADLFGEHARFEVVARAANSPPVKQVYDVEFLPQQVVSLEHRAARATASAGEEIGFEIELRNRCATRFAPIDVRLSLQGLTLVPGSARLDGEPLADAGDALQPVFGQLALPPAGESAVLSYRARASGLADSAPRASAVAVLTHRPEIAVSGEAATAGELPVSCQCGTAGSGAGLWGWVLLGLLPRRRRRLR